MNATYTENTVGKKNRRYNNNRKNKNIEKIPKYFMCRKIDIWNFWECTSIF